MWFLIFDPYEAANFINDPMYADTAKEMRGRLQKRLEETDDPILKNAVPEPPLRK